MSQVLILHIIALACPEVSSIKVSLNSQGIYNWRSQFVFCEPFPSPRPLALGLLQPHLSGPQASVLPPTQVQSRGMLQAELGYPSPLCIIASTELLVCKLRAEGNEDRLQFSQKKNLNKMCSKTSFSHFHLYIQVHIVSIFGGFSVIDSHTCMHIYLLSTLTASLPSHKFC